MSLYAILDKHGKPVAYHNRKAVLKDFLADMNTDDEYCLVRVRHPKTFMETNQYQELYLVKVGKGYVQSRYFNEASILMDEEIYEYTQLISILERELEFCSNILSKKEKDALEETYKYFEKRMDDVKRNIPCEKTLRDLKDMRDEFQMKMH